MATWDLTGEGPRRVAPGGSLEDTQRQLNGLKVAKAAVTASNDPKQQLIDGAKALDAGRTLGLSPESVLNLMQDPTMSEEERLALASRSHRRQMLADGRINRDDLSRLRAQRRQTISDASEDAELKGLGYVEEQEVNPFGMDQDDEQTYTRQERIDRGLIADNDMTEYERAAQMEARGREPGGASAGFQDALDRVRAERAKQAGLGNKLSRVFGGGSVDIPGAADLEGRLERHIEPGRLGRESDRAGARDTVMRDQRRFDTGDAQFRALLNDQRARRDAESNIHPVYGQLARAIAEENLARATYRGAGTVSAYPQAGRTVDGTFIDPDNGTPIAYGGLQGPLPNPNAQGSSAQLNAPQTVNGRAWMEQHAPGYSEGGRTFGNLRQLDLTGSTQLFSDRLAEAGIATSSNVRGIDEVDRAVKMGIARQEGMGKKMYEFQMVDGKMVKVPTPGGSTQAYFDSVLRMTPQEQSALAGSLRQLELAKEVAINQQGKQQYFTRSGPNGSLVRTQFGTQTTGGANVFFNSPEAIDPREGQAVPARIRPGQKIEGQDIKTAFSKLPSGPARDLSIGQVQGEKPRVNRYNRTGETTQEGIANTLRIQDEARARKTRKPVDEAALRDKTTKAQLVQAREDRDSRSRADRMSEVIASLPPNARRTRIR